MLAKDEIKELKKLNLILQDYILLKKDQYVRECIRLAERIYEMESKEAPDE